jgi:hypothetical protein
MLSNSDPIVLKLRTKNTLSVNRNLDGIPKLLKGLDSSGHWIFLQTHGMWTCKIKGDLRLEIDSNSETRLNIIPDDYPLIKALESVPLFHFMVNRLAVHKANKAKAGGFSPWGIHIRIKRGELATLSSQEIEVSPLAFFAATSGLHRLARSSRLQAVQSALSKKISRALFGNSANTSGCRTFHELYGIRGRDEILGAFTALASGNVRISRIPPEAVEAELTTARERVRNTCIYQCLLEFIVQKKMLDVNVSSSGDRLQLSSGDKNSEDDSEKLNDMLKVISQDILGRLVAYRRVSEELKNSQLDGEVSMVVGFSEQMGPCDFYLLASLIEGIEIGTTYVLATPLSYPIAALSSLYAALGLEKMLGNIRFILASEDVAVSKALAKFIVEEKNREKLVYLASGPTPQVLALCIELKRLIGDKVVLIPLAPPAAGRK